MDYKGDGYYIEQVLAGKIIAYSVMVDRHKDKVFNLAYRICGNREEAEEVAQDSFLKAFKSLSEFKMKSSFATWLYRITYNCSISHIRARKEGAISLEDFSNDASIFKGINSSDEESDNEYNKKIVSYALNKLEDADRAIITLYYYDEMSIDEIFEITGLTKSNIKVKLHRSRQKMLEIIEKIERKNSLHYENCAKV